MKTLDKVYLSAPNTVAEWFGAKDKCRESVTDYLHQWEVTADNVIGYDKRMKLSYDSYFRTNGARIANSQTPLDAFVIVADIHHINGFKLSKGMAHEFVEIIKKRPDLPCIVISQYDFDNDNIDDIYVIKNTAHAVISVVNPGDWKGDYAQVDAQLLKNTIGNGDLEDLLIIWKLGQMEEIEEVFVTKPEPTPPTDKPVHHFDVHPDPRKTSDDLILLRRGRLR